MNCARCKRTYPTADFIEVDGICIVCKAQEKATPILEPPSEERAVTVTVTLVDE